jgi:hypothetical protein
MNKTVVWEARYDAFGNAEILVERWLTTSVSRGNTLMPRRVAL